MINSSTAVTLLALSVITAEVIKNPQNQQNFKNKSINSILKTFPNKRIFGGETATLGQFPYQVLMSVVYKVNDTCCSKF